MKCLVTRLLFDSKFMTLTLDIADETLEKARAEARRRRLPLEEVVRQYLDSLGGSDVETPPGAMSLDEAREFVGSIGQRVVLPRDFDEKKMLTEERWNKHVGT